LNITKSPRSEESTTPTPARSGQEFRFLKAILSLLDNKGLKFTFYNDKKVAEDHSLFFYERNLAGRGLDFDDFPEIKPNFVRYAVGLRRLNPMRDTKKTPLPPLEDLADAVTVLLQTRLQHNKEPRKDFEKLLQEEGAAKNWFPEKYGPCARDLRINSHLGAGGVMTTGRIQDPEGAKTTIISFKTAAGAVAAIHRQTYKIICFRDATRGRLRVDTAATTDGKHDSSKQGLRNILIYKSHMYKETTLDPERCSHKSDQKARNLWVANQIMNLGHYEDVSSPTNHTQEGNMEEDVNMGKTGQGVPQAPSKEI
jgi:hypothetical protein